MNKGDTFTGYEIFRVLRMPDGYDLVIVDVLDMADVDKRNHNVFRIYPHGKIIWQITRIDYPETNWELKHKMAREEGQLGCIEPFVGFRLQYSNGTSSDVIGQMPLDEMDWVPGCKVELANLGFGTQWFALDVDTGVATEITPRGFKAW